MRQARFLRQSLAPKSSSRSLRHRRLSRGCHVQALIDRLWYRLDLGAEFLLDSVQIEAVVVGYEVDGETQVTETTGATDTMEVGLSVLGEVEVDDDVDGLDIDTASEKVYEELVISAQFRRRLPISRTRAD